MKHHWALDMAWQSTGGADQTPCLALACWRLSIRHSRLCTQVCRALLARGHTVVVVTGAPARMILRELPSPRLAIRKASLDFGAKQKDAFSVDMLGACPV